MKLYGSYTSPFVRHCRIALLETGCDYEFIETDNGSSAQKSPTKRVPFLMDGDNFFSDSTSIIYYLRQKSGQPFCAEANELDFFCLVNTALDTTLNVFFLERDGLLATASPYLQRQSARIDSILAALEQLPLPSQPPYNDAHLRLACFIGWANFRKRLDFSAYKNITAFYAAITQYPAFADSQPHT